MGRSHEFHTVIEGDDDKNVKKLTKEQLKHMGKIIFGIFAHPDDESFLTAATLLNEVQNGSEVHLICLTDGCGKHSMNPDNVSDLSETRMNEWRTAGDIIGVTKQHCLNYVDGNLNNDDHLEISDKIVELVNDTVSKDSDKQVEFITMDTNGVTGHIDHIVAARSALLAFYRLKMDGFPVTRVRLACLAEQDFSNLNTSFTLREPGHSMEEIDETIDARDKYEKVCEIMRAHRSQRVDADHWIEKLGDKVAVNHFIIKK